jgi:CSLREA domain-containing protein
LRTRNRIRFGILGLIAAAAIWPEVAVAADFNVNTTADGDDNECALDCTLREAVNLAGSGDQVNLPPGNFVLTNGELVLNDDTIVGVNARTTFIDGANRSRVLLVIDAPSRVSGVTIRNGNGEGLGPDGLGGGILIRSGTLLLLNSTVSGNSGRHGGGIAANGIAQLVGVTVSGNTGSSGRLRRGGGIATSARGGLLLSNSTVSGNMAVNQVGTASRGGGIHSAGALTVIGSTIAGNSAAEGGGLYVVPPPNGAASSLQNSLLSHGTGGVCGGPGLGILTATATVVSDDTCHFEDPTNLQGVDPRIGPLADNGGPTDTHALFPDSPAIGRGGSCGTFDQRAFDRVGSCDAGAYEYRAPMLTVVMQVVNDAGGTRTPSQFAVHVASGGKDVANSPQAGSANGTTYSLDAGPAYAVAADPVAGYALTVSGDCAANGSITLQEGQARSCTITADDIAPTLTADDIRRPSAQPSPSNARQLPPPEPGKSVNAWPKSGKVRVKLPGTAAFVDLDEATQLPVGTVVDARKGHLTLVAAADNSGGTATAEFWAGKFRLGQTKGDAPTTVLKLVERLTCPRPGRARFAAARKSTRRLWGDGSGKFRAKGKHSAATVVGTRWLVEDRCGSTLTRVMRGQVSVRDFAEKKTVIVRAGKRYIARARKR